MQLLFEKLNAYQGRWVTRELVLFQIMTFLRSNEAINVEWHEVDMTNSVIRIPASKMKMSRPHIVPITVQLARLLTSTATLTSKWSYVFPGVDKRKPMGATTINNALRNAIFGYHDVKYGEITSHDFRATASTWLHEEGFLHDAIELQIAHANKSKVVATYNQAEHLERRREFMQWYHDQLEVLYPDLFIPRY
jgi:integrase